jgi:non-homologous end joining protein Ku
MATKITIQIGPISAPGKVLTAVRDEDDSDLRTVCVGKKPSDDEIATAKALGLEVEDNSHAAVRVNQFFICPQCERREKSYHPYPRGKDNGDGTFDVLTPEQIASAGASKDEQELLAFLPVKKENAGGMVPHGKFYYVGPQAQPHMYGLLRDVVRRTEDTHVWVTRWAYRSAANTVRAVVLGDMLAIQQIALPEQVVAPPQLNLPDYDPRYLDSALSLVDLLAVEFNPATFPDVRKAKLAEILLGADKVAAGAAPSTPVQGNDDALLLSMQAFLDQRTETVGAAGQTLAKRTRKSPAKAPAKAAGVPTPRKRAARKPTTKSNEKETA